MEAAQVWTYDEALAWLYGRQRLGIKLGLGKVERLLSRLGNPQHDYAIVHVAGTNGKGSVVRLVASVLQAAGYRTGTTTSPHLVRFTERVDVDGQPISESAVAALLHDIAPHVAALDAQGEPPTFFEIVTALAFLHFSRERVTWAVVETGMGGLLDATNVVVPRLVAITTIDMDHMEHLGPTLSEIAEQKAGIMKPGVPCVTSADGTALAVLVATSHRLECPMSIVGQDYVVVPDPEHLVVLHPGGETRLVLGLAGHHQRVNGALALAAVHALRAQGVAIPERAVVHGFGHVRHRARLEHVVVPAGSWPGGLPREETIVLVDGAHNPGAAHAVRKYLASAGWSGFDLITGALADKDWIQVQEAWSPLARRAWTVPLRNPRTLSADALAAHLEAEGTPAKALPSLREALHCAFDAGATRILIAGSLFLAGEALAVLEGMPVEEIRGPQ